MEQKVDVWPSVYVDNYSMKPGESSNSRPFFFVRDTFTVISQCYVYLKYIKSMLVNTSKAEKSTICEL